MVFQFWMLSMSLKRTETYHLQDLYIIASLFSWICWNILKARNALIFNKSTISAMDTLSNAIREAIVWQVAHKQITKSRKVTRQTCLPQIPARRWLCFVDAAWRAQTKVRGFWWIFKEEAGEENNGHSATYPLLPSALAAEAWGKKLAMKHALKMERKVLHVLSDSQTLVMILKPTAQAMNSMGLWRRFDGLVPSLNLSLFCLFHVKQTVRRMPSQNGSYLCLRRVFHMNFFD